MLRRRRGSRFVRGEAEVEVGRSGGLWVVRQRRRSGDWGFRGNDEDNEK